MAPLLDARDRGYCVGVLQASEMGYPVYARMGFTEQFRYRNFHWRRVAVDYRLFSGCGHLSAQP